MHAVCVWVVLLLMQALAACGKEASQAQAERAAQQRKIEDCRSRLEVYTCHPLLCKLHAAYGSPVLVVP